MGPPRAVEPERREALARSFLARIQQFIWHIDSNRAGKCYGDRSRLGFPGRTTVSVSNGYVRSKGAVNSFCERISAVRFLKELKGVLQSAQRLKVPVRCPPSPL